MTTILVIEDNDDIREMMTHGLKHKKFDVITASNGTEGIHKAETERPDLILCDVMLPHLNGYEVFKRLHDVGIVPRTPFIFATALDLPTDVRRGLVMGADDYITKPFDVLELFDVIQDVLNRRVTVDNVDDHIIDNDIFISYSHEDTRMMHQLRHHLQSAGFSVWSDEEIEPSRDWAEALAEMITHSRCIVCMLSGNASQSKWVGRELGFAEVNETRVFPILVHGDPRYTVPLRLINHQFVDARSDFDQAVDRLIVSIKDFLGDETES